MKAAIYSRVSTDAQADNGTSLDTQERECVELCTSRSYSITAEETYREQFTGLAIERPMLDRLRSHIREQRVDALVFYAVDRLSRDPVHLMILQDECEKYGVQLVCVTEDIDGSDLGKLMLHIRGYTAKVEREKIRERTVRGRRERALQGQVVARGRWNLYGYTYNSERKTYDLNAETEPIVRRIFDVYLNGQMSIESISRLLNAEGIPSPSRTADWTPSVVSKILSRREYIGELSYNRTRYETKTRDLEGQMYRRHTEGERESNKYEERRKFARPENEWITVAGAIPAIVTEEMLHRAMERKKLNSQFATRNNKYDYPLRLIIVCGGCGRVFCGKSRTKTVKGRQYTERYYLCQCDTARCGSRQLAADYVEKTVWKTISESFASAQINRFRKTLDAPRTNKASEFETARKTLRAKLGQLERQQQRLLRAHIDVENADEELEATFARETRRILSERQNAKADLLRLDERETQAKATIERGEAIIAHAEWIRQRLTDATPFDRSELYRFLGIRITVPAHTRELYVASVLGPTVENDQWVNVESIDLEVAR